MSLKRLLVALGIGALGLVALSLPRWRSAFTRARRRADLATAAVMLALAISMFARHELLLGALVTVLGLPAYWAGARALRR